MYSTPLKHKYKRIVLLRYDADYKRRSHFESIRYSLNPLFLDAPIFLAKNFFLKRVIFYS